MTYDVVVVGAGPGGSCAAYHLATAGLRVALVDRARFPRAKVCGDGLTPRALVQIAAMGCLETVMREGIRIDGLRTLDLRDGRAHDGPLPSRARGGPECGTVVPRVVLDEALRRAAVQAGACFLGETEIQGVTPQVDRRGHVLHGRGREGAVNLRGALLVVADGATGRIGQVLRPGGRGRPAGFAVRQYVRVRGVAPLFTIGVPLGPPGDPVTGYGWVFPLGADLANVGVGLLQTGRGVEDLRDLFRDFTVSLARVEPGFREATLLGRLEGGAVRTGLDLGAVAGPAFVLVGDAGAMTNPFTGEGIAQALDSGRAAADAIGEHLGGSRDLPGAYADRLAALFPESSRCHTSLGWLADRGGMFAAEFWQLVTGSDRLVARALRRVTLEEPVDEGVADSEVMRWVEATWLAIERRFAAERPLLAQTIRAVRTVASPLLDGVVSRYWAAVAAAGFRGSDEAGSVAAALAQATTMLVLATDTDGASPSGPTRATWVADSTAIGTADILLADLFAVLAELEAATSARLAAALANVLGRACARGVWHTAGRLGPRDLAALADAFAAALSAANSAMPLKASG